MKHSQDARKDFAKWAAENKAKLQSLSGEPVAEKPVNYGVQLKGRKNGQEAIVTLYCGKKGFTMTFGGKATPFRKEVERAFEELPFSDEGTGESASPVSTESGPAVTNRAKGISSVPSLLPRWLWTAEQPLPSGALA